MDCSILGSILRSPYFGKLPYIYIRDMLGYHREKKGVSTGWGFNGSGVMLRVPCSLKAVYRAMVQSHTRIWGFLSTCDMTGSSEMTSTRVPFGTPWITIPYRRSADTMDIIGACVSCSENRTSTLQTLTHIRNGPKVLIPSSPAGLRGFDNIGAASTCVMCRCIVSYPSTSREDETLNPI